MSRDTQIQDIYECEGIHECPAFTLTVKDTWVRETRFYSIAGLYARQALLTVASTFMGNIAGALGANIVGNREASGDSQCVLKIRGDTVNI